MKTQIIEIIDKKIKKNQDTWYPDETRESILEELKQEILDTPEWIDAEILPKNPDQEFLVLYRTYRWLGYWLGKYADRWIVNNIDWLQVVCYQYLPNPPDIQN